MTDEPPGNAAPVELGPARLPLRVLIDPGLAADCMASIAEPFEDALDPVRALGFSVEVLPLGNLGGVAANAQLLVKHAAAATSEDAPLALVGYSRGASDILEALSISADLRSRVAAFVAIAGTINGSPLAERSFAGAAPLARFLPGARCELEDGQGIAELRPGLRLRLRAMLPAMPDIPMYSVVTFVDRPNVSPVLSPTWDILAHIDACNDGQMLAWDQVVPGSTLLALLRADHLAAIAPVGPSMPWFARFFSRAKISRERRYWKRCCAASRRTC